MWTDGLRNRDKQFASGVSTKRISVIIKFIPLFGLVRSMNCLSCQMLRQWVRGLTLIARFMGPIWGPMLAPWTLLSGILMSITAYFYANPLGEGIAHTHDDIGTVGNMVIDCPMWYMTNIFFICIHWRIRLRHGLAAICIPPWGLLMPFLSTHGMQQGVVLAPCYRFVVGIDNTIEVIVALTTWVVHHSPRRTRPRWPKSK